VIAIVLFLYLYRQELLDVAGKGRPINPFLFDPSLSFTLFISNNLLFTNQSFKSFFNINDGLK